MLTPDDRLDALVEKIFEIIDAPFEDWRAAVVRAQIQAFLDETLPERILNNPLPLQKLERYVFSYIYRVFPECKANVIRINRFNLNAHYKTGSNSIKGVLCMPIFLNVVIGTADMTGASSND